MGAAGAICRGFIGGLIILRLSNAWAVSSSAAADLSAPYHYESSFFEGSFHPNNDAAPADGSESAEPVLAPSFGRTSFHRESGDADVLFQGPRSGLPPASGTHHAGALNLAELARITAQPESELFMFEPGLMAPQYEAIPEPAALGPLLVGMLGLGLALKYRRRR